MNPLTQIKNTQKITAREIASGASDTASWHARYKDSAYIYAGGLPFDLTEGDLLAVFAQYGEIMDVNLVRDRETGKSRGFAFLAYEDQRSTTLAVDNLNGTKVAGRIVKVDHVADYKRKAEEDEEEFQKRREENGVCYAFQRGECKRGSSCKYSHDEQRNANTGFKQEHDWGPKRGLSASKMAKPVRENEKPPQEERRRSEQRGGDFRVPEPGKPSGSSNPWESSGSLFSIMAEAPDLKLKDKKKEEIKTDRNNERGKFEDRENGQMSGRRDSREEGRKDRNEDGRTQHRREEKYNNDRVREKDRSRGGRESFESESRKLRDDYDKSKRKRRDDSAERRASKR